MYLKIRIYIHYKTYKAPVDVVRKHWLDRTTKSAGGAPRTTSLDADDINILMKLIILFLVCALALSSSQTIINNATIDFDGRLANTSVELSAYAYCNTEKYKEQSYDGLLSGFKVTNTIFGAKGFIGVLPSQSAIFVVLSGTGSVLDWVVDVDVSLTEYPHCEHCKIHQGFSLVEQVSFPFVLYTITMLKLFHPSYKVVVTGHSKGGAQATLIALDLKHSGISNVYCVTFGSPRVGNEAFAVYASSVFDSHHYRITHHKDTVPSVPPRRLGYMHLSGEWYEHPTLQLYQCQGYDDPLCSAQWGKRLGIGDDDQLYPVPTEGPSNMFTNNTYDHSNNTMSNDTIQTTGASDRVVEDTVVDVVKDAANTQSHAQLHMQLHTLAADISSTDMDTTDDNNGTDAGHLTLLQIFTAAREDHMHYLSRYIHCPTEISAAVNNDTKFTAATTNSSTSTITTDHNSTLMQSSMRVRKSRSEIQREVIVFAVSATAIMLLLFVVVVYLIMRESSAQYTNNDDHDNIDTASATNGIAMVPMTSDISTADIGTSSDNISDATYRRAVQRETELTPLMRAGGAAKYHAAVDP